MTSLQANSANHTNLRKLDKLLGIILMTSALVVALYFTIKANSDLLQGGYALFMDEHLTFDGVRKILHPDSFPMFIDQVIDGKDHRYGRILWNVSSLISAIPERVWGESGQIFATRMTQSIIQLSAFIILAFTFLRSWILRGLALWALVTLPHTPYYATMPKPEPLQLLFLTIFLALASKHSFRFGYYWLFLGLAFGTKISVLTAFPLLILLGLLQQFSNPDWVDFPVSRAAQNHLRTFFKLSLVSYGLYQIAYGYVNQQLIALGIGLIFICCPFLIRFLEGHSSLTRPLAWLKTFGVFILGFGIAVPVVLFKIPQGVKTWYGWTFESTSHSLDDESNSFNTWIQYILSDWTTAPAYLLIGLLILSGVIITIWIFLSLSSNLSVSNKFSLRLNSLISNYKGIFLILVSMSLFAPILLLVKRIWGFYLHIGVVILIIAILSIIESLLISKQSKPYLRSLGLGLGLLFLILQGYITFFHALSSMVNQFNNLAQRSSTPEFQQKQTEYSYLVDFFDQVASVAGKSLKIAYDPYLFLPDSTDKWEITRFWGPFRDWSTEPDLVVIDLSKSCGNLTDPFGCPPSPTSANYEPWLLAKQEFEQHVSTPSQPCQSNLCYVKLPTEIPSLFILGRNSFVDSISTSKTAS